LQDAARQWCKRVLLEQAVHVIQLFLQRAR
jgi:hypothetical protein